MNDYELGRQFAANCNIHPDFSGGYYGHWTFYKCLPACIGKWKKSEGYNNEDELYEALGCKVRRFMEVLEAVPKNWKEEVTNS